MFSYMYWRFSPNLRSVLREVCLEVKDQAGARSNFKYTFSMAIGNVTIYILGVSKTNTSYFSVSNISLNWQTFIFTKDHQNNIAMMSFASVNTQAWNALKGLITFVCPRLTIKLSTLRLTMEYLMQNQHYILLFVGFYFIDI